MSARELKELVKDHKEFNFRRTTDREEDQDDPNVDENIDKLDELLRNDKIPKRRDPPGRIRKSERDKKRGRTSRTPARKSKTPVHGAVSRAVDPEDEEGFEDAMQSFDTDEPVLGSRGQEVNPFARFGRDDNDDSGEATAPVFDGKGKAATRPHDTSPVAGAAVGAASSTSLQAGIGQEAATDVVMATGELDDEEAEYRRYVEEEAARKARTTKVEALTAARLQLRTRLAEMLTLIIFAPSSSGVSAAPSHAALGDSNKPRMQRLDRYTRALREFLRGRAEDTTVRSELMGLMQINLDAESQHEKILDAIKAARQARMAVEEIDGKELPREYQYI